MACEAGLQESIGGIGYYSILDSLVAINGLSGWPDAIKVEHRIDLFRKISQAPSSSQNIQPFVSFYSSMQGTEIEVQAQLTANSENMVSMDSISRANIANLNQQRTVTVQRIRTLDSLFALYPVNPIGYNSTRDSLVNISSGLSLNIQSAFNAVKSQTNIKIANLKAQLNAYNPNADYGTYLKLVTRGLIESYERNGYASDSTNTLLLNLANLCPMDYGSIINTARTILPTCMRDTLWNMSNNCQTVVPFIISENNEESAITDLKTQVFDNAELKLNIEYNKPVNLEVYNLSGVLVISRKNHVLENLIDISALPAGVYIVKTIVDGRLKSGKFFKL